MPTGSWLEAVVAVLVLTGALFTLIGSLGLLRMPDIFTRLHGPSKATTIGIGRIIHHLEQVLADLAHGARGVGIADRVGAQTGE